ncbi:MBL fold metallo-hydrolase [Jatrophihabitans endophyticus]|uniref:MBL fold metallo-hydrolase n=1 Tax=Jatrophihabitans endophyticus TaxID=1206085 RepID=UPI0019FD4303|nr:MBL fold metallo-hydrolase [Jatrophihabitans endophyticus]MBE7189109.1 MBL fold metallo-hydrolase [Jatrophihabitans endophyticus]
MISSDDDRHAWERPGAFEVAPGVHRIPLPLPNDGLKAVNVYAISDGSKVVLVDAGWALTESQELLGLGLDQIGYGLDDVRDFYVTHLHRDHYTQAVAIRRAFGGTVALGEGERACLEMIRNDQRNGDIDRLYVAGALELSETVATWSQTQGHDIEDWADPDVWLTDGVDLPLESRTLRVIHTPGHTRGHVVFHDAEHGILFAGDHVLPHITPSIGVELNRPLSPLRDYLASLQLVRAMPDARLFPAHGPDTASVHVRIDELLAHHRERLDETAAAVDAGAHTGFEVARAIPWTRRLRRFDDLDTWNQILAVHETVAHLRVLVERGWLTETPVDGISRFARA